MTDSPDTYTDEAARLAAVARELMGEPIVPLPDEWLFADEDTELYADDGEENAPPTSYDWLDEWPE